MPRIFVYKNVTFWIFICKRDLKSSDLKGNMSHTPLTSGALARICQVAPKPFEKKNVNNSREKMFMSQFCKCLARSRSPAVVRRGEPLKIAGNFLNPLNFNLFINCHNSNTTPFHNIMLSLFCLGSTRCIFKAMRVILGCLTKSSLLLTLLDSVSCWTMVNTATALPC